jgi:predicted DNA-binding protein
VALCDEIRPIITVMQYDAVMPSPSMPPKDAPKATATRITITLPSEHYEHVLKMAKNKRVSASWVVRDAVARYLEEDMPLFVERQKARQ